MKARTLGFLLAALVGSSIAVGIFIDRYLESDVVLPIVIDYVKTSPEVAERFGDLSRIQVKQLTEVSKARDRPAHGGV